MQLIYTSIAFTLLQAVAAATQESPSLSLLSPTPTTDLPTSSGLVTQTRTGFFTAQGSYNITSVSGRYIVAGYTLTPGGPNQLVGGVRVTAASDGFYAGGTLIPVEQLTSESSTSTSATSSAASSTSVNLMTISGGQGGSEATQTPSTAGGAVATAKVGAAVLGGVMGVFLL